RKRYSRAPKEWQGAGSLLTVLAGAVSKCRAQIESRLSSIVRAGFNRQDATKLVRLGRYQDLAVIGLEHTHRLAFNLYFRRMLAHEALATDAQPPLLWIIARGRLHASDHRLRHLLKRLAKSVHRHVGHASDRLFSGFFMEFLQLPNCLQ